MKRQTIASLLVGLLTVGSTGPVAAVVGSSQPGSPLADSLVMVLNRSGREAGFCTGVVLAPTVVMTAAHCVPLGADLRVHFVAAGGAPVLLPVTDVERHPGYRADAIRTRQRSIDLALIRLRDPLPQRFVPVALSGDSATTPGERFTLSGYGVGREGDAASSGQLRSTDLAARLPVSSLLLWAEDPGRRGAGACTGDSGGPLTRLGETRVVALAVWSSGSGGRQCGDLTQALWLAPETGWIDTVLQSWGAVR